MKKILAALAAGVVGVVGVFFARAEGLVTAQAVSDILFGLWYSALAIVLSWVITAFAGSRHKAWAMGAAGGLCLIGGLINEASNALVEVSEWFQNLAAKRRR